MQFLQNINCLSRSDPKRDAGRDKEVVPIPVDDSNDDKSESLFTSPKDPLYVHMVQQVKKGLLSCVKTSVPLSLIKPYHFKFCLFYPLEFVEQIVQEIREGHNHDMLVYWDGVNYVMNDDYAVLLAYRAVRRDKVPVVIMGNTPPDIKGVQGGRELIPPGAKIDLFDYDSFGETFSPSSAV